MPGIYWSPSSPYCVCSFLLLITQFFHLCLLLFSLFMFLFCTSCLLFCISTLHSSLLPFASPLNTCFLSTLFSVLGFYLFVTYYSSHPHHVCFPADFFLYFLHAIHQSPYPKEHHSQWMVHCVFPFYSLLVDDKCSLH